MTAALQKTRARKGPSNPKGSAWYSTPDAARKRVRIAFSLSPETVARIHELAIAREASASSIVDEALALLAALEGGEDESDVAEEMDALFDEPKARSAVDQVLSEADGAILDAIDEQERQAGLKGTEGR